METVQRRFTSDLPSGIACSTVIKWMIDWTYPLESKREVVWLKHWRHRVASFGWMCPCGEPGIKDWLFRMHQIVNLMPCKFTVLAAVVCMINTVSWTNIAVLCNILRGQPRYCIKSTPHRAQIAAAEDIPVVKNSSKKRLSCLMSIYGKLICSVFE